MCSNILTTWQPHLSKTARNKPTLKDENLNDIEDKGSVNISRTRPTVFRPVGKTNRTELLFTENFPLDGTPLCYATCASDLLDLLIMSK